MTNECGRCGEEYESYHVFLRDDFNDISLHVEIKEEYGGLCKPCRAHLAPSHAFEGAKEVEPKVEV